MMDAEIRYLKNLGHQLLDEYISLEHKPWRLRGNLARKHAYEKLGLKLGDYQSNHFSLMNTRPELLRAISKLRHMIKKRKNKIAWMGNRELYKKVLPTEELRKALNIHR